jgi:hypothetical protein
VESIGFSVYEIILYNRDTVTSFSQIWRPCIYFSCLIILSKISSSWREVMKRGHPCFVPDLRSFQLSIIESKLAIGFSGTFYFPVSDIASVLKCFGCIFFSCRIIPHLHFYFTGLRPTDRNNPNLFSVTKLFLYKWWSHSRSCMLSKFCSL